MLRKLLKAAAALTIVLLAVGVLLSSIGVRVVLDGGGSPHLTRTQSERARAETIARHRAAQRAEPAPAEPPPASAPSPAATTTDSAVTPSTPSTYQSDFRAFDLRVRAR